MEELEDPQLLATSSRRREEADPAGCRPRLRRGWPRNDSGQVDTKLIAAALMWVLWIAHILYEALVDTGGHPPHP